MRRAPVVGVAPPTGNYTNTLLCKVSRYTYTIISCVTLYYKW
ncbi:hypothetical protein [Flavobacterium koreense]